MKVMVDLNVLLDVFQRREPFFAASSGVMAIALEGRVEAVVPTHSVTTLYYIVSK